MAQSSSFAITDILRLDVEGDGIGEVGGRTVRVPMVIPGERVEVRARPGRPSEAELVRVVSPSPHRVTPPCRHFGPCGGCAWQHIAYAEQLRLKQRLLQRLLDASLGSRAPEVLPTLPTPPHGAGGGAAAPEPATDSRPAELPSREGERPSALRLPPSGPWHYRNKVSFVFGPGGRGRRRESGDARGVQAGSLVMGHYARASRTVIPVVECPVHAEAGNRVAFGLRDALERARIRGTPGDAANGVARHVVVRVTEAGDDWLATLVVTENIKPLRRVTEAFVRDIAESPNPETAESPNEIAKSPNREIAKSTDHRSPRSPSWGLFLNVHDRPGPYLFGRATRHLAGAREVREEIAGISYLLSPTSFFQTNVRAARALVTEVLEALDDRRFARVLDLYAGAGLFALPLARDGRTVTAVEENREAVAAASAAARENRIPPRSFRVLAARVEDAAARLTPRAASDAWAAVVLDPPREGCPSAVLDWVLKVLRPSRAVYVSCNPEALARDLRAAPPAGYAITRVQPIDMFPHTAHVESVAVMDRVGE